MIKITSGIDDYCCITYIISFIIVSKYLFNWLYLYLYKWIISNYVIVSFTSVHENKYKY